MVYHHTYYEGCISRNGDQQHHRSTDDDYSVSITPYLVLPSHHHRGSKYTKLLPMLFIVGDHELMCVDTPGN